MVQALLWVMDPAQAGVWHIYVMLGCHCQKVFCVICPPSVLDCLWLGICLNLVALSAGILPLLS